MGGRRTLRFQIEMYNAFNTTQYSRRRHGRAVQLRHRRADPDTNFGKITGVRGNSNRVIQLGARFSSDRTKMK